jgi:predicted nucleic acid-binding protein
MSVVVVDASALGALVFGEPRPRWELITLDKNLLKAASKQKLNRKRLQ